LRKLYDAAAGLAPAARAAFLDAHCVDAALRSRLERMLAVDTGLTGGLPHAAVEELAEAIGDPESARSFVPGSRIGPFELTAILGEGGSSTVFRAQREVDGVRQEVALKLLHRSLHSQDARRQFRRERLALTQLRHPGIARLIEGGVSDNGLAYIALDLIEGEPITRYAREHRLDLRSRLRLFLQVCRAVEAAHRALIVHRDLKPSNVLVSGDGTVKLLDFGIAKLLDSDDDTQTRLPAFTPAYAAPEQRSGALITTATDVYALGVLLGELLTGQRLNDASGRTPSGEIKADSEPGVLPAAAHVARRQLRGDIDNVVLKALDAVPERRYASAGALAEDIERLLDARPVAAHPPSAWYRARKFVARHRGGAVVTALFLLALFGALGIALWQTRIARQEAARANAVRDFLVTLFKAADAASPKDTRPSIDDLIKHATTRLTAQAALPDGLRADLLLTLAKVADSVGSGDQALNLLDRAAPIFGRLYDASDPQWWDATVTRAEALANRARNADALALLEPLRTGLLARHDAAGIEGIMLLGDALVHQGREDEGLALLRRGREVAESEMQDAPDIVLAFAVSEAANLIDALRFREGIERADAALALWRRQGEPANHDIIELYGTIALGAEALGDIARAEAAYRQAIALDERFFDKPNPQTAWDVGLYGTFLIAQGRFEEAEPYAKRGLQMRSAVLGEGDPRTLYAVAGMGKLRFGQGNYTEAETWYSQGIDTCRRLAMERQVCARLLALRAAAEAMLERFADAGRDIAEAERMQRAFSGESSPGFAYILGDLVIVQVRQHDYAKAIATADRTLAIYRSVKGGMLQSELSTRFRRALALFELQRNDEALAEVLEIEPSYAAMFPRSGLRAEILALKAQALAQALRADEARVAARDALAIDRDSKSLEPQIVDRLSLLASSATEHPGRRSLAR